MIKINNNMNYEIAIIGYRFLGIMKMKYNTEFFAPGTVFESLVPGKKIEFEESMFNPNFYSRAADEIMKIIFTPDALEKLIKLIAELEEKDSALVVTANSEIREIINKYKSESIPLDKKFEDIKS